MVSCNFCGGRFSAKSNLKMHQTTAKYCLLLQGTEAKPRFRCNHCNKICASKIKLSRHQTQCTTKRLADKDILLADKDALLADKDTALSAKDALNKELQAQNQVLKKENSNLLAMVKIALTRSNIISEKR